MKTKNKWYKDARYKGFGLHTFKDEKGFVRVIVEKNNRVLSSITGGSSFISHIDHSAFPPEDVKSKRHAIKMGNNYVESSKKKLS
jgi:hypothetical protein